MQSCYPSAYWWPCPLWGGASGSGWCPPLATPPLDVGPVAFGVALIVTPRMTDPQCGRQSVPPQQEYAHAHPGWQSASVEHATNPAHEEGSWQKQQPLDVVMQKQPVPQACWFAHSPHPCGAQAVEKPGSKAAEAVAAVSIDPAPTAAAPAPARFSRRLLETLSSVAAIREPPFLGMVVLAHADGRLSIPQMRELRSRRRRRSRTVVNAERASGEALSMTRLTARPTGGRDPGAEVPPARGGGSWLRHRPSMLPPRERRRRTRAGAGSQST